MTFSQAHFMIEVWDWLGRRVHYTMVLFLFLARWQWRQWLKNCSHYFDLLYTVCIPTPDKELLSLDAVISFACSRAIALTKRPALSRNYLNECVHGVLVYTRNLRKCSLQVSSQLSRYSSIINFCLFFRVAFVMKKHLNTHLLGKHGVGTPKER